MTSRTLIIFMIITLTIAQHNNKLPSIASIPEEEIKNSAPYKQFSGLGLYNLYNDRMSWGMAWEQCRFDGGHLLIIDSEQELKVAKQLIKERTEAYFTYIGVHDLLKNRHFITVKDNDFKSSEYNKLSKVRNKVGNVDHCMALTSSGVLNVLDCATRYPFICEIEQGTE